MPRLDHARVHRPTATSWTSAPDPERIPDRRARRRVLAHRLEPGWPSGFSPCSLPDLPLEQMGLRDGWGERRIAAGERRAPANGERVVGVVGDQGDKPGRAGLRHPEPGAEPGAAVQLRRGAPTSSGAGNSGTSAQGRPVPLARSAKGRACSWRREEFARPRPVQAPPQGGRLSRGRATARSPSGESGGMITPCSSPGSACRRHPRPTRGLSVDHGEHEPGQAEEGEGAGTPRTSPPPPDVARRDRGAQRPAAR